MSNQKSAVVVGNYHTSLATARELHRMGYRVILGAGPGSIGAEKSRCVHELWPLPRIRPSVAQFRRSLRELFAHHEAISVIIPITDWMVDLIDASREFVPEGVRIVCPSSGVLRLCHDKLAWLQFCKDARVPTPQFAAADSLAGLYESARDIGCPVVIRPAGVETRIGLRKAVMLDRICDFDTAFPGWPSGVQKLLIQKRFVGNRYNVYFGARNGEIVRELHSYTLRTDRYDGSGQSIEGKVIPAVSNHRKMLADVVAAMKYTGIGNAQFLYNEQTDESCFLEINPRFGATYAFVERAGFELTRLAIELAVPHAPVTRPRAIKPVRFVWTYGDLAGLRYSLRHGEVNAAQALSWAATSVLSAITADAHVTWSWSDPAPTLHIYLGRLFGRKQGHEKTPAKRTPDSV